MGIASVRAIPVFVLGLLIHILLVAMKDGTQEESLVLTERIWELTKWYVSSHVLYWQKVETKFIWSSKFSLVESFYEIYHY